MRVYITHCTGIKDDSLKASGKEVKPEALYLSVYTQRFIRKCKARQVMWAIFSDEYGVWFPDARRKWYDKHPDSVTDEEFAQLVVGFDKSLKEFSEIWFYNHPSWFHSLYRRVIRESGLSHRIETFSHINQIVQ